MLKKSLRKLQKHIMCSVTLRRRNYTTNSVMQHLKKVLAEPDMVVALMETAALTALDSVALAVLEIVIAVLTEVQMAAIRNFILKVVTWTIF